MIFIEIIFAKYLPMLLAKWHFFFSCLNTFLICFVMLTVIIHPELSYNWSFLFTWVIKFLLICYAFRNYEFFISNLLLMNSVLWCYYLLIGAFVTRCSTFSWELLTIAAAINTLTISAINGIFCSWCTCICLRNYFQYEISFHYFTCRDC